MNEYRVYTIRLARHLTARGFRILRTVQDIKNPQYINWMFEYSNELVAAIDEYEKMRDTGNLVK